MTQQNYKIKTWPLVMTIFTLLAQSVHGYYTFEHISQFDNMFGIVQAVVLALIVVGGVLFFSIYEAPEKPIHIKHVFQYKKDDETNKESWQSMCFFLLRIEVLLNMYYHGIKIFENGFQYSDIPIIPVAIALDLTIPYLIYRYSVHVIEYYEPAPYGRKDDGTPRKHPKRKVKRSTSNKDRKL